MGYVSVASFQKAYAVSRSSCRNRSSAISRKLREPHQQEKENLK
jgi:hypothetical protein